MTKDNWAWTPSIKMVKEIFDDGMFPLTLDGIDGAMKELMR